MRCPVLLLLSLLLMTGCYCSHLADRYTYGDDGGSAQRDAGDQHDASVHDAGPVDSGQDAGRDSLLPATPDLLWPPNGYATGSGRTRALSPPLNATRPSFRWLPTGDANSYQIAISSRCVVAVRESCAFDDAIIAETDITKYIPDVPLEIGTTAPLGRRYFWRVRACNGNGCSDWSPVRYLDVGRLSSDTTGDGRSDLIVGNANATVDGLTNAGDASLLLGPDLLAAALSLEETTPAASAAFGESAATVGDINGDGFADFVVSAPRGNVGAQNRAGRAVLFLGGAAGVSSPGQVLQSPMPVTDARFGRELAGGGDVHGDGFRDLAIGAPGDETTSGAPGAVYFFPGTSSGVGTPRAISSPNSMTGGAFGASLAFGDLDGDGYDDLIVGAPGEAGGATSGAGRAYVYFGSADGLSEVATALEADIPRANVGFGTSLAAGQDVDSDGYVDLVVAQRSSGDICSSPGYHVVFGAPRAELGSRRATVECPSWGMNFGSGWVAVARDATGDGVADVAVASRAFRADQARLFVGSPAFDLRMETGLPGCGSFSAVGRISFGDFNGDGVDELAMAVPSDRVCIVEAAPPAMVRVSVPAP